MDISYLNKEQEKVFMNEWNERILKLKSENMKVTESHLEYFTKKEFDRNNENWLDKCSPRLLILTDTFRHRTGPCIISPHPLAIGRRSYQRPESQHSFDTWKEVRGIDLFPTLFPDEDWPDDMIANEWVVVARELNFTGIGLYPGWTYKGKRRPGLHLDVRESGRAEWGWVNNQFVSIEHAINSMA